VRSAETGTPLAAPSVWQEQPPAARCTESDLRTVVHQKRLGYLVMTFPSVSKTFLLGIAGGVLVTGRLTVDHLPWELA